MVDIKDGIEIANIILGIASVIIISIVTAKSALEVSKVETAFKTRKEQTIDNLALELTLIVSSLILLFVVLISENILYRIYLVVFFLLTLALVFMLLYNRYFRKRCMNRYVNYILGVILTDIPIGMAMLSRKVWQQFIIIMRESDEKPIEYIVYFTLLVLLYIAVIFLILHKRLKIGKANAYFYGDKNQKRYIYMAKDKEYVFVGNMEKIENSTETQLMSIAEIQGRNIYAMENKKTEDMLQLSKELEENYDRKNPLESYKNIAEQLDKNLDSQEKSTVIKSLICYYESKVNNPYFHSQLSWAYAILIAGWSGLTSVFLTCVNLVVWVKIIMIVIYSIFIFLCILLNVTAPKQDKNVFILNVLKLKFEEYLNTDEKQ